MRQAGTTPSAVIATVCASTRSPDGNPHATSAWADHPISIWNTSGRCCRTGSSAAAKGHERTANVSRACFTTTVRLAGSVACIGAHSSTPAISTMETPKHALTGRHTRRRHSGRGFPGAGRGSRVSALIGRWHHCYSPEPARCGLPHAGAALCRVRHRFDRDPVAQARQALDRPVSALGPVPGVVVGGVHVEVQGPGVEDALRDDHEPVPEGHATLLRAPGPPGRRDSSS